jgi:DNA-binding NtrC family response regulator
LANCSGTHKDSNEKAYLEIAMKYADESDDYGLMISARTHYLAYLTRTRAMESAHKLYKILLNLLTLVQPSLTTVKALLTIADNQKTISRYDKVVKYLKQALHQAQALKLQSLQIQILNKIGSAYSELKDYAKAEKALEQSLSVAKSLSLLAERVSVMFNLGIQRQYQKKYESAIECYDQCLVFAEEKGYNNEKFRKDIYNNYSICYWRLQDYESSLSYLDKSKNLAIVANDKHEMMINDLNRAHVLVSTGDYESAEKILLKTSKFFRKTKHYNELITTTNLLARLYHLQNNSKQSIVTYQKLKKIYDDYTNSIMSAHADEESQERFDNNIDMADVCPPNSTLYGKDIEKIFVGKSQASQHVLNSALLAAQHHNTNVMIIGESGTGKEIIANIIHDNSIRKNNQFIAVNSPALTRSLIESELFGHTKGSFTGADTTTKGIFLQADKGTLFLDEITEMPLEFQPKLLRVIENRKVSPVGSSKEISFDSRIISATNQDIRELMEEGRFRLDLFHRLNTIEIYIPPLRERKDDIETLIQFFVDRFSSETRKAKPYIDKSFVKVLLSYNFPGNVRELKNIIERMFILSNNINWDENLLYHINPLCFADNGHSDRDFIPLQNEKETIIKALVKANGQQKIAANMLKMSESTLCRRIVKYGLKKYTNRNSSI